MITVKLVSAAVVCTLWFVDGAGRLWLLFAVAMWYGLSTIIFNAAMTGHVQATLPIDQVGPVNGLLATVKQALRLIGPIIGAGLFTAAGGRWVATLDAATFVLSAALLIFLRREATATRTRSAFGAELVAGLRHLWVSPPLRALACTTIVFSLAVGVIEPTVYALVDGLGQAPPFVSVLVSVQGAGAVVAGVTVSVAIRRVTETRLIVLGLALIAAGVALCTAPSTAAALAGFVLIGIGQPTFTVGAVTLLQRRTPNAVMGRAAAGYDMLASVPTTASIAAGAVLVAAWPYQAILALSAAGCAAAAVVLIAVTARRARITATPISPAAPSNAAATDPGTGRFAAS